MNYTLLNANAMHILRRSPSARSVFMCSATAGLAFSLSACANGPETPKSLQNAAPVTHNCKPRETVGFSCELSDQRLLSLCASPDFLAFKGAPQDNPGYAYVAIGSQQGRVQYTYPQNPQDYKNHMYFWVSLSASPHLFVSSGKAPFLGFSLDEKTPATVTPNHLPDGWPVSAPKDQALCSQHFFRDHLDPFMAQMVTKKEWDKRQPKQADQ